MLRRHPVHEGMFASGGSDGSVMYWNVGSEKESGVIEAAHESIVWCLAWHPAGHILTTGSNDHTVKFWSRNRPGDSMRDKYNLNTLPPGQEEDYGNIGDLAVTGRAGQGGTAGRAAHIPGMGPEDRVESGLQLASSIPGLDVAAGPDPAQDKKKQPFSKPIPRSFQANWNTDGGEPDRGVKRTFGSGEGGPGRGGGGPGFSQEGSRKENKPPLVATAIPLAALQAQASAIVAKGQIIPVLPGSPLFHSIAGGETAIKEVLNKEFNIGGPVTVPGFGGAGGGSGFGSLAGGGANFGGNNYNYNGQQQQGGGADRNFGGRDGRRQHSGWERAGRDRM